jgi:hypothetical protein
MSWLEMIVFNPVFWLALAVFVFVVGYMSWSERKEKEKVIEQRLKDLEEKLKERESTNP